MNSSPPSQPDLAAVAVNGRQIGVRHRRAAPGAPTVLFLCGYASDMTGQKATAIDAHCAARGIGCLRFDYSGTGESAGAFSDGSLADWTDEAVAVADLCAPGDRIILAGSSLGGWIALHVALRRPERVAGLLGIAAAPDFTDWGFSEVEKEVLRRAPRLERTHPNGGPSQIIHGPFWRSGDALRLLDAPIEVAAPVRLIHGTADANVPMAVALRLLEQLGTGDVQLRLLKGAGHRLGEPHEIAAILAELDALVATTLDLSPATPTSVAPIAVTKDHP